MSLARPWEDEYRRLLLEIEKRWSKSRATGTSVAGQSRWDAVAWDEYPGFAGERDGEQCYVSLKADLLSLSVFRPLGAHVVIRPEGFVDRFLKAVWLDWEFQTGNPVFDHRFYIERVRTDEEKRLVCDPEFQKLIEKLEPFVSLAVTENGVHWSLAIEGDSHLTVGFLDDRLGILSQLAKLVPNATSGGNR
jgi:hypothetical protein